MNIAGNDPLHLGQGRHNIRIALVNEGLGNQAFQYIFSRWIELTTKETCYLDDTFYYSALQKWNSFWGMRQKRKRSLDGRERSHPRNWFEGTVLGINEFSCHRAGEGLSS